MGKLSTHVLDTSLGKPAANLVIRLYKKEAQQYILLKEVMTNNDGRCDEALLENETLIEGGYELEFDVQTYFNSKGVSSSFLQDVVIRFYVSDSAENYHVPLLITPFSYSTYRGS